MNSGKLEEYASSARVMATVFLIVGTATQIFTGVKSMVDWPILAVVLSSFGISALFEIAAAIRAQAE